MKQIYRFCIFSCVLLLGTAAGQIYHGLDVKLDPQKNHIQVSDTLRFTSSNTHTEYHFLLHDGLKISGASGPATVTQTDKMPEAKHFGVTTEDWSIPEEIKVTHYILKTGSENIAKPVILTYAGVINHEIKQLSQEYARGFSETPGIINSEGVYLSGSSYWIPWFNDDLITFKLRVSFDPGWDVVSQGRRTDHGSGFVIWTGESPTEEVHLIGGQFTLYTKAVGSVSVMAYLRTPDAALADKYLETTGQYLEMYRTLIGPYPYSKFALVENFWETGYGMPSFTLLGSKVIRFPFILHSSYPHELLHNWWGNGVYVDYTTGNWCEGLTAYLADHLIKEQRGQGSEYRRTALQAYTDYVNESNEIALKDFRSRTDAATSAIGYNKSLMVFNMIRHEIGDELFIRFLQNFYRQNKFNKAGFSQIRQSLESVTGKNWTEFFTQWIEKAGAPQLELKDASYTKEKDKYKLTFSLSQIQETALFQLKIPVAVTLEGEKELRVQTIDLTKAEQQFNLFFAQRPEQLFIDPEFDVFRTLDRNEIPPSLSHIFGTKNVLIVIPADEKDPLRTEYLKLAEKWASDKTRKISVVEDDTLFEIPSGHSVWLFGLKNKFIDLVIEKMSDYNAGFDGTEFRFGKTNLPLKGKSIVTVVRNPQDGGETLVWMHTDVPGAVSGLGRKLPHYGKYSYLAFEGAEPTNTVKGQWAAVNSPLFVSFIDQESDREITFPERVALASLAPVFSEEKLRRHVGYLADEKLEGRGFGSEGLWQAADYIAEKFREIGLKPGGEAGTYFQRWSDTGGANNKQVTLRNVIGVLPGTKTEWDSQTVVVCAHYDHLGRGWPDVRQGNEGKIHPGADDNASGVALLIELARTMAQKNPGRSIIFTAFTAEESGLRGSKYFIQHLNEYPIEKMIGVLNLDTVGRLFQNKLLILGSSSADEWKHIAMGVGFVTGIPYEIVNQDLDASDQVSFLTAGVPGLQFFSGAHSDYHRPGDTVDRLDIPGMVKVATFVKETLTYLADERDLPLTVVHREVGSVKETHEPKQQKRAATGIMPDFVFSGPGVKVGAVGEGSAAEKSGIQTGDIILSLGGEAVSDLQSYANILRRYQPGDEVSLTVRREDKTIDLQIVLGSR